MKVLISSTRRDLDLARDLARRLQAIGLEAFTEDDAESAEEDWFAPIERRLRASDEVVVLLTDRALASDRMMSELGAAYAMHKKVTPIIVGVNVDELPPLLKNLPYIKYSEVEDYISKLKKRVKKPAKVYN
jgi:hypothetical protein